MAHNYRSDAFSDELISMFAGLSYPTMRLAPLLFCFFFCLKNPFAQPAPVCHFEQLPTEIGLTHSTINCIAQDFRGFLWFGTWSGLVRYDGYRVRVFRHESANPDGLQSDQITSIFEDSQRNLWVGTIAAGIFKFDRTTEKFTHFGFDAADPNSLSDNDVWHIFESGDHFLWVSTKNGLNRFDPKTGHFSRFFAPNQTQNSFPANYNYSACQTADGSIWAATPRGLNRFSFKKSGANGQPEFRHFSLNPAGTTPANVAALDDFLYVVRPSISEPSCLLVASKAGLKKVFYQNDDLDFLKTETFRAKTGDPTSLSHNVVADFLEEKNGNLWVSTFNGLNFLEKSAAPGGRFRQFLARPGEAGSLSNNVVRPLFQDRTGILWIGTDKGINKLNLAKKPFQIVRFSEKTDDSGNVVFDMDNSRTAQNRIWVATSSGLNRLEIGPGGAAASSVHFNIATGRMADFANFVSTVRCSADGKIWLGTKGAGLLCFDEKTVASGPGRTVRPERQLTQTDIGDDHVMHLLEGAGGRLWLALWDGGLSFLDKKTGKIHRFQTIGDRSLTAFPNVSLEKTIENGREILWVGTRGSGLLKTHFDPADGRLHLERHFRFDPAQPGGSLPSDRINHLFADKLGRIWASTGDGVAILPTGGDRFEVVSKADGLPDKVAQAVREDGDGNFWVSTQNGIARLSFLEKRDEKSRFNIRSFDALDGLQDNFFNSNCALRLPDGQLAFGGVEGLNLFFPEKIRPDSLAPQTAISDFWLFNKSVAVGQPDENGDVILPAAAAETPEIKLTYRENVLSFEFASLHFSEPKKNRFAYKLEGFDPDWVITDAEKRFAHYTNLPYRDFVFLVKSCNADGIWSAPVSVKVSVAPPFWLTNWAFFAYFLALCAVVYGVFRATKMREEFRSRLALERVEREKVEEVSRLKLQFFTNLSHELRTPLTLIVSPLEQLIHEKIGEKPLQKTLAGMHHHAGRLLTMINQLLDFRKSEAGILPIHVEKTDLSAFVEEAAMSFRPLAEEHRIRLQIFAEKRPLPVWLDPEQMEKVVFNLLSNALKFAPDGGSVTVKMGEKGGELSEFGYFLQVSDTGPGIPPTEIDLIFDPFHQVEGSSPRQIFGGTGIGLSLAKAIVEQHGGRIEAANLMAEGGQGGAVFTVFLKAGNAHFSAEQIAQSGQNQVVWPLLASSPIILRPEVVGGEVNNGHDGHLASSAEAISETTFLNEKPDSAAVENGRQTLLLVEDNADIRAYLKEHFEADFDILEAEDGQIALEIALETPPDLVLSDVAMPKMDGIELCRRLKTDIRTSHLPVVLLTARTSVPFKIEGFETGADDYVTKPFNLQLLKTRVRNLVAGREKLRALWLSRPETAPEQVTTNPLDEAFLKKIVEIMEAHLDESEFSVDDLARKMLVSRIQLYRKIKALTGDAPNALMRNIRLRKAAQLIKTGHFTISEVAYKTGFSDLKYFRERFKELFGKVPSEY